jgi:hypothetical protein
MAPSAKFETENESKCELGTHVNVLEFLVSEDPANHRFWWSGWHWAL